MTLTPAILRAAVGCSRADADLYAPHLAEGFRLWNLDTPHEIAAALAQFGHETAGFTLMQERLGYSAARLADLGRQNGPGSRWAAAAKQSARLAMNPQALANFVYADRMGNGDEASGDGWRYRGRGFPQLTGRANYISANAVLKSRVGADIVADPDAVANDRRIAALTGCAYWHLRVHDVDPRDVRAVTRAFNGGVIGLDDRRKRFAVACRALGVPS